MYEELVKRLRNCAELHGECALCPYQGNGCNAMPETPLIQAADAIEELANKPRWISVEERLPEQKINQNTLDFEYVLCATTFGDVRPYKFGRRIGQGEPHFWNGAGYVDTYVTHWMPLPEPPEEETP